MQWLLLSVKIQKMISVWWFANKVTYHIDAERNPTGSIVGRTSNNEERSYYKMEVSNNYSTAKLWGTSDKKVSKSSEKNKWKLTDSLKEKIVELAKKDAQDNVYMGNAFMNLRKMEVSKVAPNRAALIGKFNQSMNSGNMSAMKEVEKADKKWLCILFGIPYEAEFQGEGTGSAAHVYNECGEEVLTYTEGVGWQEKETKAETKGINAGSAEITVASSDGKYSATCKVTVTASGADENNPSIVFAQSKLSLTVGQPQNIKLSVAPANADIGTVSFSSSSDAISVHIQIFGNNQLKNSVS